MTTAGCAGAPALPVGSFVPSRSGRGWSAFLWLVFALADSRRSLTGGIIRTSVTWRRIRTGVPRILATLAELAREAAAKQVKALVNALHAKRQAAAGLALLLTVSMTPTFTGTPLTPQPRSVAHQPHRSGARASSGPRMVRKAGSGPQHDQNRCQRRKKPKPRSKSQLSAT
jgi:hypothetical protein